MEKREGKTESERKKKEAIFSLAHEHETERPTQTLSLSLSLSLSLTETLGSATISVARICSFILTQVWGQFVQYCGTGSLLCITGNTQKQLCWIIWGWKSSGNDDSRAKVLRFKEAKEKSIVAYSANVKVSLPKTTRACILLYFSA
ncbi:hypothetical protein PanWU01x14_060540 [Parasponia andersonii]|uniref:Uncharacterized protein n=1 Tax=Parasponia andersonii TaxID=3476 RepID=A0A2P5DIV2_PARAD|nr:hypothetical protein PanWU01x14_060540 [Parasponia andersonii]